ncbi:MAG: DUF58 domain-containing protein [Ilumatobacteraceae bacterium]
MRFEDRWRPTAAHARAMVVGLLLAVIAVLGRRPDLLVLATPFLGAALWAVVRRPTELPGVRQRIGHATVREGDTTVWHVAVDDPEGRVDDVAVLLEAPDWIERKPLDGQTVVALHEDGDRGLDVVVRSTRWGRRRMGPALVVATSAWGGFRWTTRSESYSASLLTLPQTSSFDATAPPVHVPGLIGVNRSPRPGAGSEFASIRPFQPGDRLRRIHWPTSVRTGALHVSATWADHDRHVVLLVDAVDDVGESGGIDGRASSLDVAVRAAGAIAEHYVHAGDRVALVMMGARGVQRVPPASGSRHLRRLLDVLSDATPAGLQRDDGRVPRGLGGGALVVMLSPLTSPPAIRRAAAIADQGISLLVVDCLPDDITRHDPDDPYIAITWRIELLKRDRVLRTMREAGIAVVPWRGPGSLDVVLRDLQHHSGTRLRRAR